jgi:hypothetical protein
MLRWRRYLLHVCSCVFLLYVVWVVFLVFLLIVVGAECIPRPLQLNNTLITQVIKHVLVDELVLAYTLHHKVPLLAKSSHDAEYWDAWWVVCSALRGTCRGQIGSSSLVVRCVLRWRGIVWSLTFGHLLLLHRHFLHYLETLYDIVNRYDSARATYTSTAVYDDLASRWKLAAVYLIGLRDSTSRHIYPLSVR